MPLAVLCGQGLDFVIMREAATLLDLVFVPLPSKSSVPEIRGMLARAGTRLLVVDDLSRHLPDDVELWSVADLVRVGQGVTLARPRPGAFGQTLLFTSGTTGEPKACLRSEAAEAARAAELIGSYGLSAHDVHLVVCPLSHSAPGIFLRALRALGARTAIVPHFEAVTFAESVRMAAASVVFMVPTQVQRLLALPGARSRADLAPLRAVIVAGAPFPPAARQAFAQWLGPGKLWEFYGASETGTICVRPPDELAIPGLVGRPPPGVTIELRDPAGQAVPEGAVGEVFVQAPTLMSGYLGEPPLAPGAAISVGDLGRMTPEGLVLVDRLNDTLISGGVNVYPAEIERVLAGHPDVAQAVVTGMPDAEWGDKVCALVALKPGCSLEVEALSAFCRNVLAPAKRPKAIRIVPLGDLPIGSSGKPVRRLARPFFS